MKKLFTLVSAAMLCLQSFALDYSNPGNNNYVNEWGKLKLVGNQLSSESGQPVQLRGWSTHGKNWHGGCFDDRGDFELMKSKGANLAARNRGRGVHVGNESDRFVAFSAARCGNNTVNVAVFVNANL